MNNPKPHLMLSPSFGDAGREISTVEFSRPEYDNKFEFFVTAGALTSAEPADEIFSNGWILPVYPVFNRGLLKSDPDPTEFRSGSTSSTSSADSIEIEAENCNARTPRSPTQSPHRVGKVGSGSGSKKWRMKDLIGGRRSHSDGKDKLGFSLNSGTGSSTKGKKDPKEMDMVTAHRLFYGNRKGDKKKDRKRSFLPYRPELVGLFANSWTITAVHSTFKRF